MASAEDRETFKDFLRRKPFVERWWPAAFELFSQMAPGIKPVKHSKSLPDYCYNILAVFRRTSLKAMPAFAETIKITDAERLKKCQTMDEAKEFMTVDWRRMGRVGGIGMRGMRFFELEVESYVEKEGLGDLSPAEEAEVVGLLFGENFPEFMKEYPQFQMIGNGLMNLGAEQVEKLSISTKQKSEVWSQYAYQAGPEAMIEFNKGIAEGMASVMDENGRPPGESVRSNVYWFLLLAWPEIKEMLESNPKKTMSDLWDWMQPFMRVGVVNMIDLDYLRDVCAPVSQSGIGLSLRPLSSHRQKPSA
jgi:hypothetical protein